MDDHAWKEFRQALTDAVDDTERKRLLREYEPLTKERLDLGRHAGVLPRAGEPVYRWVRYKEAYSPQLVRDVLDELLTRAQGPGGRGRLRPDGRLGNLAARRRRAGLARARRLTCCPMPRSFHPP